LYTFPQLFPLYKRYHSCPLMSILWGLWSIVAPWGKEQLKILELLGLKTEVIWKKDISEIGVTANEIRQMIQFNDNNWQLHIPKSVRDYIINNKMHYRIQNLTPLFKLILS